MSIEVDSATGGSWEELGALIRAAGKEDASGYRRFLARQLTDKEYASVATQLSIAPEKAVELRQRLIENSSG